MHLSYCITKLNLKRSLIGVDIYREVNLKEMLVILPVYICLEVYSSVISIEVNLLSDEGIAYLSLYKKGSPYLTYFNPLCLLYRKSIPVLFGIEDIYIPVIIVNRLILIHTEEISFFSRFKYLSIIFLVKNT